MESEGLSQKSGGMEDISQNMERVIEDMRDLHGKLKKLTEEAEQHLIFVEEANRALRRGSNPMKELRKERPQ